MARKAKGKRDQYKRVEKKEESIAPEKRVDKSSKSIKKKVLAYAAAAFLLTLICYIPSLDNDFIPNWDDGGYILEYNPVHEINGENLKTIFSVFYKGNYHPITTLFYAVEYSLVADSPFLYHFNNLIFHLLNVLLVFWLIYLISGKRILVSVFVATFFGIHPMHVESVAWISERKDVLYAFFYMGSLICYLYYNEKTKGRVKLYIASILLFYFSLLSKSMAVTLPVILFLFDFYQKKKITRNLILEKIPFFAGSIAFGLLAIFSQAEKGAIQDLTPLFAIHERLAIVSYSLCIYIGKLFAPFYLSAMYPYPDRIGGALPLEFLLSIVPIVIVFGLVVWSLRKTRYIVFGFMFFLISIVLVLQLLPVGGAILAERYTYMPYIGLLFIIGMFLSNVLEIKKGIVVKIKPLILIFVIAVALFFSYVTIDRISYWDNGEKLFIDVAEKYPNLPFAYNNLGYYHYKYSENNKKAIHYLDKCISIDTTFHSALSTRGVINYNTGKYKEAVSDFTRAIRYKSSNKDAWIGRANTYSTLQQYEKALPDYNRYIKLNPDDAKAFMWKGTAYYNLKEYDKAMEQIDISIKMSPKEEESYYWKAVVLHSINDYANAVKYFDISLKMNPNRSNAYSWRGIAHYNLKNYDEAIQDYTTALSRNPKDGAAFINRAITLKAKGEYKKAFADYKSAGDLGFSLNKSFFMELKKLAKE